MLMTIKDFCEQGYLQELNRQFLHPLGLALSVDVDKNGTYHLADIHDHRDDPEGVSFDLAQFDPDVFRKKAEFVQRQLEKRSEPRLERLGFVVQPVPASD